MYAFHSKLRPYDPFLLWLMTPVGKTYPKEKKERQKIIVLLYLTQNLPIINHESKSRGSRCSTIVFCQKLSRILNNF